MRNTISSDQFSHDLQIEDVLDWLEPETREAFGQQFPEFDNPVWNCTQLNYAAMGCDSEITQRAANWIEANTPVYWDEGEPWNPILDEEA